MNLGLIPGETVPGAVEIIVRGLPVPQGSVRAFVNPVTNRAIVVSKQRGGSLGIWRNRIASEAQRAMEGRPPLDCAVRVQAVFVFPRPSIHLSKRGGLVPSAPLHKTTAPDLDKALRAVFDGMSHVIYRDDVLVVELSASKVYGPEPGVRVRVTPL